MVCVFDKPTEVGFRYFLCSNGEAVDLHAVLKDDVWDINISLWDLYHLTTFGTGTILDYSPLPSLSRIYFVSCVFYRLESRCPAFLGIGVFLHDILNYLKLVVD